MLFNSLPYLFFMLATLALYWAFSGNRYRKVMLLIASYAFYMNWFPPYGLLLFAVTGLSFLGVRLFTRHPQHRKPILTVSIICVLSFLLYYKYWGLLATTLFGFFPGLFGHHQPESSILLPLAISFFTFHAISYMVDVYTGRQKRTESFLDYALYIAFFPQLLAGPIVRSTQFMFQLEKAKRFAWEEFGTGLKIFVVGLLFKMIADQVSPYANLVFAHPGSNFARIWIGIYSFALQIFCDFAGYTAMARGSALLFGYRLPRNFRYPYFAPSITEFWRRWHMSLSSWLKQYLYIPLGGNRKGRVRTYLNLIATMGLGGLWHGASWTFLIWGLYHGLLLSIDKKLKAQGWFRAIEKRGWFIPVATVVTFHLVCIGWVIFRATSFDNMTEILANALWPHRFKLDYLGKQALLLFLLFMGGSLAYINLIRYHRFRHALYQPAVIVGMYTGVFLLIFFFYRTVEEFIYFQF